MGDFEQQYVYTYTQQPLLYLRFLDDIFLVWQYDIEELDKFLTHMNTQLPSIKFTMEYSKEKVNFLDTTVSINHASHCLETDLYSKPTDTCCKTLHTLRIAKKAYLTVSF